MSTAGASESNMSEEDVISYEIAAPNVARITLNRPQTRNAQDTRLLYALNDAFERATRDDDVKVIILAANGPHFSSGHDVFEAENRIERLQKAMSNYHTVTTAGGFERGGAEGYMAREEEIYTGFCERWRSIPKPTIAQVHGRCIAGGLMLVWPCDLVMASDDAQFLDNTVDMGVGGVELFQHAWEFGVRKAKELLFTADWLSAQEALRLGMVNHVVPRAELAERTLQLAQRIARKPSFALKLAKEALNASQDAQGRKQALHIAFGLHQLAHWHNHALFGSIMDPTFYRETMKKKPGETRTEPIRASSEGP
jgi:enoyl-CoA hydratase/carnithine racemase